MNSLFSILFTSIFFIFSGWNISLLNSKITKIERVGLSFLLGAGLTTFIWYLAFRIGLPLNLSTAFGSGLILHVVGLIIAKIVKIDSSYATPQRFNKTEKILTLSIIISLLIIFAIGLYRPLTAWDSLAQYDFRGHAIALDHNLSFIDAGAYYLSYPLMISLVHAIVYMLGGISAQGIHAVIFSALIAVIYGRIRYWTNTKYALITCLLIIAQNEIFGHATFAYTNLPYTAYLVSGILYAISPGKIPLIISALLIGCSTWVRSSEVFWFVGLIVILIQSIKYRMYQVGLITIIIIMSMRYAWASYVRDTFLAIGFSTATTASHITIAAILTIPSKLIQIYWYIYLNIIYPYLGMWAMLFPLTIVTYIKRSTKLFLLLISIILSGGIVVGGVMIFSTYYPTWNEIGDSARRMMLFIVPLSLIASVYALFLLNNKKDE